MPETLDIIKANGGPANTCWSLSFMNNLNDALSDKVDLNQMKYIIGTANLINYTASHDNTRLFTRLNEKLPGLNNEIYQRLKLAAIILATSVGIPLIWQGDQMTEIVSFDEENENKIKVKRPMNCDLLKNKHNRALFDTFKRLFVFRHNHNSLGNGVVQFFHENANDRVLGYRRDEDIMIICHFANGKRTNYTIEHIISEPTTCWIDILTNRSFRVNNRNSFILTLNSYDEYILLRTDKRNSCLLFLVPFLCFPNSASYISLNIHF